MKARIVLIPLFAIALASCDKVKTITEKAASTVREQIAEKIGTPAKPAAVEDPELAKLVDRNDEGVIFRKDLPFPQRLEVRTTRRMEMSGRFFQTSAIEKRADTVNGILDTVVKVERAGDQGRFTLEQSSFTLPSVDGQKGEVKQVANPIAQMVPTTKSFTFQKKGNTWQTDGNGNFHAALLAQSLGPELEGLLIDNALAPRPLWFSKRRMKIGDELDITGASLPMLLAGDAKGSFHLKFETIEPVDGHPCGVFSVTGDYHRKHFPDFEGKLVDEDVTIESGKIWLSLLHPIILKEELDTIQSSKSGGEGGLIERDQGSVKVSVKRDWKPLAP